MKIKIVKAKKEDYKVFAQKMRKVIK